MYLGNKKVGKILVTLKCRIVATIAAGTSVVLTATEC